MTLATANPPLRHLRRPASRTWRLCRPGSCMSMSTVSSGSGRAWSTYIYIWEIYSYISISTWKIIELAWTLDSIQATDSQLRDAVPSAEVSTAGGTPSDLGGPLTPDSSTTLSGALGDLEISSPTGSEVVPVSPTMQQVPQEESQDGKDNKELTFFACLGCCHKMIEFIQVTLHIFTDHPIYVYKMNTNSCHLNNVDSTYTCWRSMHRSMKHNVLNLNACMGHGSCISNMIFWLSSDLYPFPRRMLLMGDQWLLLLGQNLMGIMWERPNLSIPNPPEPVRRLCMATCRAIFQTSDQGKWFPLVHACMGRRSCKRQQRHKSVACARQNAKGWH